MEIILKNQSNTLGSLLLKHLESNCNGQFATCSVPQPTDDFLLVNVPDKATLRKALLDCRQEIKELEIYLHNYKRKSS